MSTMEEQAWENEYWLSDDLQNEFSTVENFIEYRQACADDLVDDPRFNPAASKAVCVSALQTLDEKKLRCDYEQSQELQDVFSGVESYLAFKRHESQTKINKTKQLNSNSTGFDEATATDEQLKTHFEQPQKLKDEFSGFDSYLAYIRYCVSKRPRRRFYPEQTIEAGSDLKKR